MTLGTKCLQTLSKLFQIRRVRDSSCSRTAALPLDVPCLDLTAETVQRYGSQKRKYLLEVLETVKRKIHHSNSDRLKSCNHHPQHVIVTENSLNRLSAGFRLLPRLRQLWLVF